MHAETDSSYTYLRRGNDPSIRMADAESAAAVSCETLHSLECVLLRRPARDDDDLPLLLRFNFLLLGNFTALGTSTRVATSCCAGGSLIAADDDELEDIKLQFLSASALALALGFFVGQSLFLNKQIARRVTTCVLVGAGGVGDFYEKIQVE